MTTNFYKKCRELIQENIDTLVRCERTYGKDESRTLVILKLQRLIRDSERRRSYERNLRIREGDI